jgi:ubiquinone/menaquinone biosynthesis C-methylase UbiE
MDYLIEFYKHTDRQGPGDVKYTEMAFNLLDVLPPKPKILDIGCGSGKQTITLAKLLDCEITAIDYCDCFLEELAETVKKERLEKSIKLQNASMFNLPFVDQQFDIIWSEGAIYIMGFEKGLKEWKRFIKPQGYMVVTEISWLRKDIPEEIFDFWKTAYPDIGSISQKIETIENNGYKSLGHLILPEYGWLENYYLPLKQKKEQFFQQYGNIELARQFVENEFETELKLYRKYKDYYSYVFYIMKKI